MKKDFTGRRLIISHNPHSSRAREVQAQVFDRLEQAGYNYETIEVQQAHLNDNVARLAPLIRPGDIVLSAAGDGSAHATAHAVMAAGQPGVELGFLAYGNFNDLPNTFNSRESLSDPVALLEQASTKEIWPLDVSVDSRPLRSALLYATIGWTARAANQYDDPKVRHSIQHGGAGIVRSLQRTGMYYLKSRSDSLLPPFRVGGERYSDITDILLANGPAVARLFKTGNNYYQKDTFLCRMIDVRGLVKNVPFLVSSLAGQMKGEEIDKIEINFDAPSSMVMQCDGEVVELQGINQLEVKKAASPLTILTTK